MTFTFHLANLDSARIVIEAFAGSCLDPDKILTSLTPKELLARNSLLFTSGGSLPRKLWANAGLGATIQTTVVETSMPMDLIDFCSMTNNTILGINDPWVKLKQIAYLLSSQPHFLPVRLGSDLYYRVARRILRCLENFGDPGDFIVNLRQCSGSDVVELALHAAWKVAANFPKRRKLATFSGSYHGEGMTSSLISEKQIDHGVGQGLLEKIDNVILFPSPKSNDGGYLSYEALETLSTLERDGDLYFAVIIEPIQWRNSVHAVPVEFLRKLRDVCTRKSICLIFDETQSAFGFAGTVWFAQKSNVCPDIMVTGKGLTSGHGSAAVMVAKKAYKEIEKPFGNKTNSGDMLSFVAVDAVMDRLLGMEPEELNRLPTWIPSELVADLRTGLLSTEFSRVVKMLEAMLTEFQRLFPSLIGDLKGVGLVRGIVMLESNGQPSERLAAKTSQIGLDHAIYVRQGGSAVLIKPCLASTEADFEKARVGLHRTFQDVLKFRNEKL